MPKLLITGASGLLGANLVLECAKNYSVIAVYHRHPIHLKDAASVHVDLTDERAVEKLITAARPDWVVHCAAETNVDRCEQDHAHALLMNRDMAGWVARAAMRCNAGLIHISTDAVFDGRRAGLNEQDAAAPPNVYGRSKLEGENEVLKEYPAALVVRTNFFGWNAHKKHSLAEWFLDTLQRNKQCNGFSDIKVKMLLVNDLIAILLQMIERRLSGIYHVLARDCISKYEFGVRLAAEFELDKKLINPMAVEEAGLRAVRALNLCLSTEKIEGALRRKLPSVAEGLRKFHQLQLADYPHRLKVLAGDPQNE